LDASTTGPSQQLRTQKSGLPNSGLNSIGAGPARHLHEVLMIQSFRDLEVWQKSMDLTVRIYKATESFPRAERCGLTSQLRRASTSIASNIAEGKAMGGLSFPRHLRIAHGSEAELQTQLELAKRLQLLDVGSADELLMATSEVGRMLVGLKRRLPRE
jgi:four helix bundle protein